jgi:hypothetical protein
LTGFDSDLSDENMSDMPKDEGSRSLLADLPVSRDQDKREENTRRHAKGVSWV